MSNIHCVKMCDHNLVWWRVHARLHDILYLWIPNNEAENIAIIIIVVVVVDRCVLADWERLQTHAHNTHTLDKRCLV